MFRLLIIFFAILGLVWVWKSISRAFKRETQSPPAAAETKNEDLVKCEYCGTMTPSSNAYHYNDHVFCSELHAHEHKYKKEQDFK